MDTPLTLEPGPSSRLRLRGDWTLAQYSRLRQRAGSISDNVAHLDATDLTALDTAGATLLVQILGAETLERPQATDLVMAWPGSVKVWSVAGARSRSFSIFWV